ncbi:hypothetical protein CC80DRAFT_259646 [Byssothecium circinans]|uniref:RanBD1 domain-containing protein n=1 Tax=Byssothecium circinans TaxID=147558 RepID=A0A6A5U6P8_9PLEO|nr:hypothetical protein CC80DRAFT_259646 [Byssothecium circinans]
MMMEPQATHPVQPSSPSRSDRSSDSEGKPVREKLKETRIDAKTSSDLPPSSDQPMNDVSTNGAHGDHTSGSDSDRGRLRRKRSREAFEGDDEVKNPEKKQERHQRKKSRDVNSPVDSDRETAKPANAIIPPITEHDGDETMHTTQEAEKTKMDNRQDTPETDGKKSGVASPKNKRTREEAEASAEAEVGPSSEASKDFAASSKLEGERTTKRPRDGVNPPVVEATESNNKIPLGSGFSNTSATSPFATMSPQKPASKSTEASVKDLPQTSSQAFTNSGFGSFATSTTSPFGAVASGSSSPFGAAAGNKLTSFASGSSTPAVKPSGFASLGSSSGQSAFGGNADGSKPVFGGALSGSAFGGVSTGASKLSSFGTGGSGITGLTQKPVDFGSKEQPKAAEDESTASDNDEEGEGNEDGTYKEPERKPSSTLLQPQGPIETGEENEDTAWSGRAKLYTLAGGAGMKAWQERGVGPFKLNVTREAPKKARFVLRADGTHRLILNAAITKSLLVGDADGKEPKDGKVLFNSPTATGELESHLLKLKAEKATELWTAVEELKKSLS